jgi:hypothetical protein
VAERELRRIEGVKLTADGKVAVSAAAVRRSLTEFQYGA